MISGNSQQDLTDVLVMVFQVLHMDRNDYYGGDSTSLNLNQVSNSNELNLNSRGFIFACLFLAKGCLCYYGVHYIL